MAGVASFRYSRIYAAPLLLCCCHKYSNGVRFWPTPVFHDFVFLVDWLAASRAIAAGELIRLRRAADDPEQTFADKASSLAIAV